MSLKDELELKNSSGCGGFDSLQEQINRLGEEVALDINDLEKRINTLQSVIHQKNNHLSVTTTPHSI